MTACPRTLAVIAFGLVVSLLGFVSSAISRTTGRFATVGGALGIGCGLMLLAAAAGVAAGV